MNEFGDYQDFIRGFAIYPSKGEGNAEALAYAALGLTGEAGEYSEKIKKLIRDGKLDVKAAALELGDVLWYLTRSAEELGFDLDEIAQMNVDKLTSRKERGVLGGSGDNR